MLSDPRKRQQYDLYGEEGLGNRTHRHSYQYSTGFEFELFRQMFGTDPWADDGTCESPEKEGRRKSERWGGSVSKGAKKR